MIESGETGRLRVKGYKAKKNRITASIKRDKFHDARPVTFSEGQQVNLEIGDVTPMGYKAVINSTHPGMLYKNEVFQSLNKGQVVKGFIKKIREDGKIDLSLQRRSAGETDELSSRILNDLKEHGGTLYISDRTSPEKIYNIFGISKKRYKNVIGALYKKHLILIEDHAIRLVTENKPSVGAKARRRPVKARIKPATGRGKKHLEKPML